MRLLGSNFQSCNKCGMSLLSQNVVRNLQFGLGRINVYRYASHNDVSVNDGPLIRQWSHKIILQYNILILTIVL